MSFIFAKVPNGDFIEIVENFNKSIRRVPSINSKAVLKNNIVPNNKSV